VGALAHAEPGESIGRPGDEFAEVPVGQPFALLVNGDPGGLVAKRSTARSSRAPKFSGSGSVSIRARNSAGLSFLASGILEPFQGLRSAKNPSVDP